MFKNGKFVFKENTRKKDGLSQNKSTWNVLIVDDEEGVHEVTKLALAEFEFEGKKCNFISAYSAEQAKGVLNSTSNIALALVDVVMETENAGLELVDYIRKEINNKFLRIILRTGQPGQAPEEEVIYKYDINDYKSKSELTTQKLFTAVLTSLRTYKDMLSIEKNRMGLRNIIKSSSSIENISSLDLFLSAILEQIVALFYLTYDEHEDDIASFVAVIDDSDICVKIAGSGRFNDISKEAFYKEANEYIKPLIIEAKSSSNEFDKDDTYLLYRPGSLEYRGFVLYMELKKPLSEMDKDMLRLFFDRATVTYENSALTDELDESQKEIIFTISEIAEKHSIETGKHVKRVALYSKLFAEAYGLSKKEVENIYRASPMHDIGKMVIADSVLNKPGRLDEGEMLIMKKHAGIGEEMLKSSKREILKMAALIAGGHHEKYDGSGYPRGLKGEEISIYARIVALADVFDALGSTSVYKKSWEIDDIVRFIKSERAKHFDPKLVDLFFQNFEAIIEIRNKYQNN